MAVSCDPIQLANAARCFKCIPVGLRRPVFIGGLCDYSKGGQPVTQVILPDGAGGYWQLVVDSYGNLGAEQVATVSSQVVILDDGYGGFWKLIVDTNGNRGAESNSGPATVVPTLTDAFGGVWQLIADSVGNIGTTSV